MKLWSGRFKKDVDSRVNDFNSSISFDGRMYKQDIEGSIAHATMLGECGIIEKHESEKIVEALKGILADIEAGRLEFSSDAEDIHMNIETILTERIGDTGKRLHTARSRNDQVALDIRMYLLDETKLVKSPRSRSPRRDKRKGESQCRHRHGRLHTSPESAARHLRALYPRLRADAHARL